MNQPEVTRLLHRIERNCVGMVRIVDEPGFPLSEMTRAMHKRMQAFARREEQLMLLIGPIQSHTMAFRILTDVLQRSWRVQEKEITKEVV